MNNVYVRSNTSIKSITLTRIFFILPLIVYGLYKNGYYLYQKNYIGLHDLFKPLIILIAGALVGLLVNIIYEKLIKKNKGSLIDIIFSSFHVEYGLILGCLSSINTNIFVFISITFVVLFLSKFINNRFNIMALAYLLIYTVSHFIKTYSFLNIYEYSKKFELNFLDYLIGRSPGGIASTHIILLIIAIVGLYLTNTNKTNITISSIIAYIIPVVVYGIIKNQDILSLVFACNYLFIFTYVATDSVTSCYTSNGIIIYGVLIGILTFVISLFNVVAAPYIAILIISLLNNLIDRKSNILKKD